MNPAHTKETAWNHAFARLSWYLATFALGNRSRTARLALEILDEARVKQGLEPARDPVEVTMKLAQARVADWLASGLHKEDQPTSSILPNGCIAVLLSRLAQEDPDAFLAFPVSDPVRRELRQTLVVTGPDLTISSMTPREMDFGPMLDLARQTWHRFDPKSFGSALLFWIGVYCICYWGLSEYFL